MTKTELILHPVWPKKCLKVKWREQINRWHNMAGPAAWFLSFGLGHSAVIWGTHLRLFCSPGNRQDRVVGIIRVICNEARFATDRPLARSMLSVFTATAKPNREN